MRAPRRGASPLAVIVLTSAVALPGCPTAAPRAPSSPPSRPSAPADAGEVAPCLPLVSGCGCAYTCARGHRRVDARTWEVVHDLQDSRLDRAVVERWCFTPQGHGSPEGASVPAGAERARCLEVFFDGTPCGGECIPSTSHLRCVSLGERCSPSP